jgi:RIP homotypic interaction motif
MESVSLVTTALAAGASQALKDEARASVKTAYAGLKALVTRRLGDSPRAEMILDEHEQAPQTWAAPLEVELAKAGADSDPDVVAAAQELMALLDTQGWRSGKYVIDVSGSQGIQVGDHNTQVNTFGRPPSDR